MKNLLKFTASLFIIIMFLTVSATFAQAYTGNITVESKQVKPGDNFSLDMRLSNNNVDIGGLFVPMHYSSSDIIFDSATFVGSLLTSNFSEGVSIQPDNVIWISYIPNSFSSGIIPIVATDGLIATLHFTVSDAAIQGLISVDSINEVFETSPGSGTFAQTNVQVSDPTGDSTFYPEFTKGIVSVTVPTGIEDNLVNGLPGEFALAQNYPNPFNPATNIDFALPTASHVKLEIFNVLGQLVKTLVDNSLEAGIHSVEFDASSQSSGIFFYRLTHKDGIETKKMILIK